MSSLPRTLTGLRRVYLTRLSKLTDLMFVKQLGDVPLQLWLPINIEGVGICPSVMDGIQRLREATSL